MAPNLYTLIQQNLSISLWRVKENGWTGVAAVLLWRHFLHTVKN